MASPKIQIKRGTVVPPYTLSTGELALNTTAKNLFVQTQTADTKVLGGVGSELVVANVVFTIGASVSNPGSTSGVNLIATFDIVTSGTTGYNARLFNVGTILKINNLTTSEFYVTSVTNATTFSVRQVGNAAGATALTAGTVLSYVQLYANSMTWIGAQIDTAISGTGTYDRLVSQKGITDYVSAFTAGTVSLNEMGDTSATYYPVFAESTGNSVYRDYKDSAGNPKATALKYDPNNGKFTAPIFVGGLEGTVGSTGTPTTGAFSTISGSDITGTGLGKFSTLQSTVANGTAPFVVASSTVVTNLNANSLNGQTFSSGGNAAFGTVSATGQITSTVTQGTTPFLVTSSTVVSNLNANLLNGATFAAPGAIGGTTASTGAFTDLTTTGTTTHNGNFTVNGTQTYLNTTVMTVTDKNIELGFGVGTTGSSFSSTALTTVPSFASASGTVAPITGSKGKITFGNTTSIPVGVRPGTQLTSSTPSGAGFLGVAPITVTSITPTQIFYTAASGTPIAGTNSTLAVANEFTGNVTVTGTTTANMVVGSLITVTNGTALDTPAVAQILSANQLTIVVRTSVTAASTFSTGAATDTTAEGGGITLKGATDKTLTWVSNTKNWTFNQGLETSSVDGNAGLTVNTFASTDVAMVGLVLSNYNTSGGSGELSPAIQFKSGTNASTSTTGYLLVTNGQQFEFHNGTRGIPKFSVSSTGAVGDCTIDCGAY